MDLNILETINMRELGQALQRARKKRGLTQAEAARIIDVARTTITAIEKGERRIKPGELIRLARAYGSQVSDLVRSRPQIEPFRVQFRGPYRPTEVEVQQIEACKVMLEELCRNYYELEQMVGAPLSRNYPPEYDVSHLSTEHAAEYVASAERNRFGLGDEPVPILRDLLEQQVGLRIFYLPLNPSKFSEMYHYDDQLGGCMAVNISHPEERRRWSLAHGYAHFLVQRYQPTAYIQGSYQRKPESERFADYFARHFLMPTSGLTRRFNGMRQTKGKITPADLCALAHHYGVSVEAITLRVEEMKLLPTGTWDRLRESGFKVREAQEQLGLGNLPASDDKLPMRYQYLALHALDQGLITEGQFARFLGMDRLEARHTAERLRQHASGLNKDFIDLDLTQLVAA